MSGDSLLRSLVDKANERRVNSATRCENLSEAMVAMDQSTAQVSDRLQELERVMSKNANANMSQSQIDTLKDSFEGNSLQMHIWASFWQGSGLISETLLLQKSNAVMDHDELLCKSLFNLAEPWFDNQCSQNEESVRSEWARQVCCALRLKIVGRFLFSVVLRYVREQIQTQPVKAAQKLEPLAVHMEQWLTTSQEEVIEKQFLLKEIRIGRRADHLPLWNGSVSSGHIGDWRALKFLNPLTLAQNLMQHGPNIVLADLDEILQRYAHDTLKQVRCCIGKHLRLLQTPPTQMEMTICQLLSQEPLGPNFLREVSEEMNMKIIEWINKPKNELPCELELKTESNVHGVSITPDGKQIAFASKSSTATIFALTSGVVSFHLPGHTNEINCVAISKCGTTIATGSDDKTIKLWDSTTGKIKCDLRGHDDYVRSLAFSPDGRTLASTSNDKTLRVWNLQTETGRVMRGHARDVNAVSFSCDGKFIATGSGDKSIKIWGVSSGDVECDLMGHSNVVTGVAFHPFNVDLIASCSSDATIQLWSIQARRSTMTMLGHTHVVTSIAFHPSEHNRLLSASYDTTFKIWDTEKGLPIISLTGHSNAVTCVAFHPIEHNIIITGSMDESIKVWNLNSIESKTEMQGHQGWVKQVQFISDGLALVSQGSDGATKFWDGESGSLIQDMPSEAFTFVDSISKSQKVGKYIVMAQEELILVHYADLIPSSDAAVAFFRATSPIETIHCFGDKIAAGCQNGDVLYLRAVFLGLP